MLSLAIALACSTAAAAPAELVHSGRLLDVDGAPLQGPVSLTVNLESDDGTILWDKTYASHPVSGGYYTVTLTTDNSGDPIDTSWLAGDLWIEVVAGGSALSRQKLVDVPRAAVTSHIPVESSGQTGSCDDPGAIAWDTASGSMRVCDGALWRQVGDNTSMAGFITDSGAFRYSDGGTAERCRDYREPPSGSNRPAARQDGAYWIDADGAGSTFSERQVYCDMTRDSGGWTRIATIQLGGVDCVLGAGASGDTVAMGACTKLSDAEINAIAVDQVYVNRIGAFPPTFTHYSGSIHYASNPGNVIQGSSFDAVRNATPSFPAAYGGWQFTAQNNWYQADMCLGASPHTTRPSFEYLDEGSQEYVCLGACNTNCQERVTGGHLLQAWIR